MSQEFKVYNEYKYNEDTDTHAILWTEVSETEATTWMKQLKRTVVTHKMRYGSGVLNNYNARKSNLMIVRSEDGSRSSSMQKMILAVFFNPKFLSVIIQTQHQKKVRSIIFGAIEKKQKL